MRANQMVQSSDYGSNVLTSLEEQFARTKHSLNDSRRQLIQSILDNPEDHFYLSARKLAKLYGVDASTVVRTIQALGYEKFDDFAADLRKHFVSRISPYTILKSATREKRSVANHIAHSLEGDNDNLAALQSSLEAETVIELAKTIHRSRRILVIGIDLAASLANFLAYGLTPLGFDAEAPVGSSGNLHHKIDLLTSRDLVIAISFGRCLKDTVEAAVRARQYGVRTFGITDSDISPLAAYCDDYLLAAIASPSFTGSYVAPIALMNTILVACAHVQPRRSLERLRKTEEEYRSGDRWYKEPVRRGKVINMQSKNGDKE